MKWRTWTAMCAAMILLSAAIGPGCLWLMRVPFYMRPPGSAPGYHHGELYTMELAMTLSFALVWALGSVVILVPAAIFRIIDWHYERKAKR